MVRPLDPRLTPCDRYSTHSKILSTSAAFPNDVPILLNHMLRLWFYLIGMTALLGLPLHAAVSFAEGGSATPASANPASANPDPLAQQTAAGAATDVGKPAQEAANAFAQGRFDQAVKLAKPLADKGDGDALYLLGIAHETGQGLEKSRDKALAFYRKASVEKQKDAPYRISLILLASDDEAERNEARKMLETAAKTEVGVAGRILGEAYLRGRLSEKPDVDQALSWWKRSAEAGDMTSIMILAAFYEGRFGYPEKQSAKEAIRLYNRAAALRNSQAMVTLGSRLLNGPADVRDEVRGREWLKTAIEAREYSACLVLGDYEENEKKNYKAAVAAYQRGSDVEQVDCMLRLADMYLAGRGVDKDADRGQAMMLKAAEKGSPVAQFRIAAQLLSGEKPELGAGYVRLLSAANGNLLEAQNELGLFYLSGKMGVADHAAGVAWLTRAAKSGNAAAQNNLGTLYEAGAGSLERDLQNALELYGLAAGQGHAPALLALARLLSSGGDVKPDLPKAWAMASLVAEAGDESAKKLAGEIDARCDAAQRKQAQQMLKDFKTPTAPKKAADK